jgi:uncharacterized small protein (DUF1192 family)
MFDESKRQRAMRVEVGVSKQALGIVKPINERIANWQSSAALLKALSYRGTGSTDRIRRELGMLSSLIHAERQAFAEQARHLPERVATSGRILDTNRALQSLEQTLDAALAQCARSADVEERQISSS